MLKISGPIRAALFAAVILTSGAGTGLSIDIARADNCVASPKAAAPRGQHWYYHIDRATRRKCWYLHATMQLPHRTMIRHHAAAAAANADPLPDAQTAAAPVAAPAPPAWPAAPPTASAPAPDDAAANAPPAPHVTMLTVRTSTPFVATAPAPQQSTSEKAPVPSAPQTLSRAENTAAMAGTKPADGPEQAGLEGKADAAFGASVQAAEAATAAAKTRTGKLFILLAAVFGVAAALTALIAKIAGNYRTPRISIDPDAAQADYRSERRRTDAKAISDQRDVPFVDPHEHYGLADLHAQEWLDRSPPAQDPSSMSQPRAANFTQPESQQPAPSDIEAALRVLRQARQRRGDVIAPPRAVTGIAQAERPQDRKRDTQPQISTRSQRQRPRART